MLIERIAAVELLKELVRAEVEVMKQANSNRGITKKAAAREFKAVREAFKAMTGSLPANEEVQVITEM